MSSELGGDKTMQSSVVEPSSDTAEQGSELSSEAENVREEVLSDVRDWFETANREELHGFDAPDETFLSDSFFEFSYLDGRTEVERYWVNKPFAYVSVLEDETRQQHSYHVNEPVLDTFEQHVRADLIQTIRNRLMYRDITADRDTRRAVFDAELDSILSTHAATVEDGSVQKLRYYLVRDFIDFGRLDPLMRDEAIEDISCDGTDVPVFIYHQGYRDLRTNISFGAEKLNSLVVRLAQWAGKHLSISDPLIDASLPDGSRIQLTLGGDVTSRGSNFTIRKFSDVPLTPVDLIRENTFSVEEMAYLWLCIENNRSLVFAGGTGAGKTTSLNAVSFFIPPESKVVSIEDTREIVLPHENWVQSLTRDAVAGRGDIDTYRLLQTALRQRPEYLLVGEIRTDQRVALTFFQAISTGHTCYTTVHADTVDAVLSRLQNPPLSVPTQMLSELDIISIQKQVARGTERHRRNQTLAELTTDGSGGVSPHPVFKRDATTDRHEQVAESQVVQDIAELHGWTTKRVASELESRERVLAYLIDEDITDYTEIAAVIHTFQRNPEYVMARIDGGDLSPELLTGELQ